MYVYVYIPRSIFGECGLGCKNWIARILWNFLRMVNQTWRSYNRIILRVVDTGDDNMSNSVLWESTFYMQVTGILCNYELKLLSSILEVQAPLFLSQTRQANAIVNSMVGGVKRSLVDSSFCAL